jgi:hypothetical protein
MTDLDGQERVKPLVWLCDSCGKPGTEARPESSPGMCERCYADGWRSGPEMMAALEGDPVLDVDGAGNVGLERHKVGVLRPSDV